MIVGDYIVNTGTATLTILGVSATIGGVVKSTSATAGTAAGNIRGTTGATGSTGSTGPAGPGLPTGGTADQVAVKNSSTDYDVAWQTLIVSSTSDLTPGTSPLDTGTLYVVYE